MNNIQLKNLKDFPKKIWRKSFSKKDLRKIFGAVLKSSNEIFEIPFEEWYQKRTKKIIIKYGGFLMHLETDRYDDLTGIQPETIKEYLENHNIDEFKEVLNKINIYLKIMPETNLRQSKVLVFDNSEGILSLECDDTFRNFVYNNGEKEILKEIAIFFGERKPLEKSFWNNWKNYLKEKNDLIVYRKIIEEMNIPIEELIKEGVVNLITERRKKEWQQKYKRIPQVKELILVNPNNFDFKEHSKVILDVYGKQLKDLPEEDRKIICQTIDALGKNLNTRFLGLFKNKKVVFNYFQSRELHGEVIPVVSNDLLSINGFADLDNSEKIQIVLAAAKLKNRNIIAFNNLISSWKRRKNLKIINLLVRILKYLDSINYNNIVVDTIAEINDTYPFFKILNRYTNGNIFNPFSEELIGLMKIYSEKTSEQNIPVISGKVGSYLYEILDKDNPIGLVLGYATDCCQTAYGAGAICIKYGYNNPNSAFFKVEKKNTIYAQSWIWQIEKEGLKILVFDSIEFLGDDINQYAIIPAYEETAKRLISEHDYDLIIAVSSPNVALDSVPWPIHEFNFFKNSDFAENGYFDFNGKGHILGISKNKILKKFLKQESEKQGKENIYTYLKKQGMIYKRAKKEN